MNLAKLILAIFFLLEASQLNALAIEKLIQREGCKGKGVDANLLAQNGGGKDKFSNWSCMFTCGKSSSPDSACQATSITVSLNSPESINNVNAVANRCSDVNSFEYKVALSFCESSNNSCGAPNSDDIVVLTE